MITKCKFNKHRDIQEVVPNLEISIHMAMQTGIVKDTATSAPYTKETDVNNVGNYLHDNIEVAMALKGLNQSLSSMPTSTTPASVASSEPKGE